MMEILKLGIKGDVKNKAIYSPHFPATRSDNLSLSPDISYKCLKAHLLISCLLLASPSTPRRIYPLCNCILYMLFI